MDSNLYQKPEFLRYGLAQLLGDGRTFRQRSATYFTDYHWILGLLVAEGDQHRQQVLVP